MERIDRDARQKIAGLIKKYGFETVWKALREVEAKRLAEKRRCLLTGRTLCHEALCAYCTENCPLAGAFITKEKEVSHEH